MRSTLIAALAAMVLVNSLQAVPPSPVPLTPTDDAYTDIADPGNPHDNRLLDIAFSGSPSNQPSKIVFLKFDLGSVTSPINQATLNMAVISDVVCVSAPDAVDIAIYKVTDDSWSEATLTWNNQPARADNTVLDTLDEGAVSGAGYYHWSDAGSDNLAAWLESQRTGDGTASLRLEITGSPGLTEAFFEDREGTGANASCLGAEGPPILQVADLGNSPVCPDFEAPLGVVGLEDVQAVAGHWRQWDDDHDVDQDGDIDVVDIERVAMAWGPCP